MFYYNTEPPKGNQAFPPSSFGPCLVTKLGPKMRLYASFPIGRRIRLLFCRILSLILLI